MTLRLLLIGVAALIVAGQLAWSQSAEAKAPSRVYVSDTGHALAEPFLSHWADYDGTSLLGLPISEPVKVGEKDAQYFQFGYLYDASKSSKPRIKRADTGQELLRARHDPDRTVQGRRVGGDRAAEAFLSVEGAGHTLPSEFADFIDDNGGEKQFGEPISEPYWLGDSLVQWFEYARLEWPVDRDEVRRAAVGFELARARGVDTAKVKRGKTPLLDPNRYRVFVGDGTYPEAKGRFSPTAIVIPAIGVDANIERVGITDGVMDTPEDAWKVGWYDVLSTPGERTNVVMAGHRDWWGLGPVVFWNLEQLRPGDKIYLVDKKGRGATYVIEEAYKVGAGVNANKIIGDSGGESLTLITCGGDFNGVEYAERHIVHAERI